MAQRALFPGQRSDENVLFVKRRHWFILLRWVVPPLLLLLAMLGAGLVIGIALELEPLAWALAILLLIALPVGLVVWRVLDWENDHYILTDQRVIHIERVYFLFESRHEAALRKIQDVTFHMPSPLHNILDFGDVQVETAGTEGQIQFEAIPNPREIQIQVLQAAGLQRRGRRLNPETPEKSFNLWGLFRAAGKFFARMLYPVYPRRGVVVWRKHWFVLLKAAFAPAMAALLTGSITLATLIAGVPGSVTIILATVFVLLVAVLAFIFIDWHNDIYILTTDRVIDIEKRPFTMEFRREANMGMIQDVSYEQPGFIAKALNFGNVRLETAGTLGEFTFDNVPGPSEVQNEITRRLEAFRAHMERERARREEERMRKVAEKVVQDLVQRPSPPPTPPPGDAGPTADDKG